MHTEFIAPLVGMIFMAPLSVFWFLRRVGYIRWLKSLPKGLWWLTGSWHSEGAIYLAITGGAPIFFLVSLYCIWMYASEMFYGPWAR
jgi:hypothetical protein